MRTARLNLPSIAKAAMLAGPIFVSSSGLAMWMAEPNLPFNVTDISIVPMALVMLVISAVFGSVIAIIPCVVGAWLTKMVGEINDGLRAAPVWAIAGGMLGAIPHWLSDDPELGSATFALIVTGACCALICRIGVRWDDDVVVKQSPVSPTLSPRISAALSGHDAIFLQRKDFLR